MDNTGTERLLNYLRDAVRYDNAVAPFELCHDSQTQWLVGKLKEQEGEKLDLLDYGCGNLRLLNALHEVGLLGRMRYVATDLSPPTRKPTDDIPFVFKTPQETRRLPAASLDVAVLMNVVHEIPTLEFSDIIETIRRLLKKNGTLFLVDMAVLPEGEYRALPYYPWELESLFFDCVDCSYASKSGVPVVALEIPASAIPIYSQFVTLLAHLLMVKRDLYSELACSLSSRETSPSINELLCRLSLNHGDAHDLGYLMLMSGFANYKLIEWNATSNPSLDDINDAAIAILQWFFQYWGEKNELPLYFSVLDELGADHSYNALSRALSYMSFMSGQLGAFFMPVANKNLGLTKLTPSESLDVFEDRYNYDDIRKLGLGELQEECHRVM